MTLQVERVRGLMEKQGLQLEVTEEAKDWLAKLGYDPMFGARPLKRFLQRQIETTLARALISGDVAEGSTVTFKVKGDALVMG